MKKTYYLMVVFALAGFLSACGSVQTPATMPTSAEALAIQPTSTQTTEPNPTQAQATETAPAATETKTAGKAIYLSQVHMVDTENGWGWAASADTNTPLLRTTDGGLTWKDVSPEGMANPYAGFFLDAQTAWIPINDPTANTNTLLRTTDGGKTWTSLRPVESAEIANYHFSDANNGIAETAGVGAGNLYLNLYETKDGGTSWTPILITPPSPETGLAAGTVHLCNICGDSLHYDASRIVIAYGELANEPSGAIRLAMSTDLGKHWKNLKLPIPDKKYASGMAAPQSPTFFGSDGIMPVNIIKYNSDGTFGFSVLAIYITHDGGQSWSSAPALLENDTSMFQTVEILSMQTAYVRCGKNLCSTNDGAQSWQTLPANLNFDSSAGGADYVMQFQFITPTDGWALSGENDPKTLWKTNDGGITWIKILSTLVQ